MRVCVCCGLCGVFDFVTFDNHCPLLFKVFRGMGHRDKNSERRTFLSLWYRLRKGLIFLIKKVLLLVQLTKETFDQRGGSSSHGPLDQWDFQAVLPVSIVFVPDPIQAC